MMEFNSKSRGGTKPRGYIRKNTASSRDKVESIKTMMNILDNKLREQRRQPRAGSAGGSRPRKDNWVIGSPAAVERHSLGNNSRRKSGSSSNRSKSNQSPQPKSESNNEQFPSKLEDKDIVNIEYAAASPPALTKAASTPQRVGALSGSGRRRSSLDANWLKPLNI